jgi:hypothetical protein
MRALEGLGMRGIMDGVNIKVKKENDESAEDKKKLLHSLKAKVCFYFLVYLFY